jgi:hypothetical protein
MKICGTVWRPDRVIISCRSAGSPATLISRKDAPFVVRRRLAAWQKPQEGVV